MWQTESESIRKLSLLTVTAIICTCKGMIALIRYLFAQLDFILLGNICSDYLEGRFGWYRQLCGANYYNSVTQFLQAEKTIRLRSLVNMGFDMTQIKVMFETAEINQSLEQVEEIKLFTSDLESFKFHNTTTTTTLLDSEQAIIYYIAGYIAKSLTEAKCIVCRTLVSPGKVDMPLTMEELPDKMIWMIVS